MSVNSRHLDSQFKYYKICETYNQLMKSKRILCRNRSLVPGFSRKKGEKGDMSHRFLTENGKKKGNTILKLKNCFFKHF